MLQIRYNYAMTYTTIHIVRFIILSVIIFVSFLIFSIPKTNAYFTTGQEAVALDNHSALFLIEYSFGMGKRNVHLPVLATNTTTKTANAVSYIIIDETGKKIDGKMSGIVFSDALLSNTGMYVTPKGASKKFTLAVVFTPQIYVARKEYRLQVTHLPFNFDGSQQLQLNPSELKYYTTKLISLD